MGKLEVFKPRLKGKLKKKHAKGTEFISSKGQIYHLYRVPKIATVGTRDYIPDKWVHSFRTLASAKKYANNSSKSTGGTYEIMKVVGFIRRK